MKDHPIKLAYAAQKLVPLELFRTNQLKKKDNPVITTPALCQAMIHLGKSGYPLTKARDAAANLAYDNRHQNKYIRPMKEWKQILKQIETWENLLSLLDTMSVFLKARSETEEEPAMREFQNRENRHLKPRRISEISRGLLDKIDDEAQENKLQQMAAHVTTARDKWEALAALARFYPRNGIPKPYVNALVQGLEATALDSFKQVVAQSLIFYKAEIVEKETSK
jgi:hypothetical protein